MVKDYLKVAVCLRQIRAEVIRGRVAYERDNDTMLAKAKVALRARVTHLEDIWPDGLDKTHVKNLDRHANFAEQKDFDDMYKRDIPALEETIDDYLVASEAAEVGFAQLLHPKVSKNCLHHYNNGHYREAVFNATLALTDSIRERTGIDKDGVDLASEVFKSDAPRLVFSENKSVSGKNDQEGFHLIMLGTFKGIRNPKAHGLKHDLTHISAAQYLVFISLLIRRVDEAELRRPRRAEPASTRRKAKA